VIVRDVSSGQRLRRAAELVLGVALGIAIGDALIYEIGTGAWQVGLSVLLATLFTDRWGHLLMRRRRYAGR
jgi:uncharacterized membrane protein YgaE (UPF0421/DUF939 family)